MKARGIIAISVGIATLILGGQKACGKDRPKQEHELVTQSHTTGSPETQKLQMQTSELSEERTVQTQIQASMLPGQVDIFMGVDFNYRDILFNGRVFDLLINLTPGVKWNLGHRWEVAAQVYIPIVNQYGARYKRVRLNMAVLSKQWAFADRLKLKVSGGLFGSERYGLDVKAMLLINRWLALSGDFGFTGYCSMAAGWEASTPGRFTAIAGPEFWIAPWQTQMTIKGGRFLYSDYGVIAEGFRHFKHVSVGAYAQYSSYGKENFGFKIIVMLPPYKRTRRRFNFRPASNFRLTYNNEADGYSNADYFTDPEQNEREGWFDRDLLPWGPETIAPDFTYKDHKAPKDPKDSKVPKAHKDPKSTKDSKGDTGRKEVTE